jgi:hypothetical protein
MESSVWKEFSEYIKKYLDIDKKLLDLLAVDSLLHACVAGLSNKTISNKFNCNIKYIENVLKSFLDFKGWTNDLDLNIYNIFISSEGNYNTFSMHIDTLSSLFTNDIKLIAFNICSQYKEIERIVDKYYE